MIADSMFLFASMHWLTWSQNFIFATLPTSYTDIQGDCNGFRYFQSLSYLLQNEEVINFITIPNVALNLADYSSVSNDSTRNSGFSRDLVMEIASKACFYSGDWGDFNQLLFNKLDSYKGKDDTSSMGDESQKFDIILTSETIYNPECYQKLLTLMTNCLKQDGVMYPFILQWIRFLQITNWIISDLSLYLYLV